MNRERHGRRCARADRGPQSARRVAGFVAICWALLIPGCNDPPDLPARPLCEYYSEYPPLRFDYSPDAVAADSHVDVVGFASHSLIDRIDSVAIWTTLGLATLPTLADDTTFVFSWMPVDSAAGIVAGTGTITAWVSVTTLDPPPDSTCQFARNLRVQVDTLGTGSVSGP